VPAIASNFFNSGAGLGASICAIAAAANTRQTHKIIPDRFIGYLLELVWNFPSWP
jgi:hypothetical protein